MSDGVIPRVPEGRRSRYLAAADQFPRAARVEGSTVTLFVDEWLPGADMYGGIFTTTAVWHPGRKDARLAAT